MVSMVSRFDVKDIPKIFKNDKIYEMKLSGRDLNIIIAALEIPIIPTTEFEEECEKVRKKLIPKYYR